MFAFNLGLRPVRRISIALVALVLMSSLASADWKNTQGMSFVEIPAGSFLMGTADIDDIAFELPDGDVSQVKDETPAHTRRFAKSFYLMKTEVTQQQWLKVMGSKPGPVSHWQRKDWQRLPVVSVNWFQVQDFIKRLNKQDKVWRYRLPSEAEWEYAARAARDDVRGGEIESLPQRAWYLDNSNDEPQAVAKLAANPWGLYDMLGNAWEWVADTYSPTTYQAISEGKAAPQEGAKKVRRGGSYHCKPHLVRFSYRAADTPDTRYSVIGFRLIAEKF